MREAFHNYLLEHGAVAPEVLADVRADLKATPEPLGVIAFGMGLLTREDIEHVLAEQALVYEPFGQIAIRLGMFDAETLEHLLFVQRVRSALFLAEALAVRGATELSEVMQHFGRFLEERRQSEGRERRLRSA